MSISATMPKFGTIANLVVLSAPLYFPSSQAALACQAAWLAQEGDGGLTSPHPWRPSIWPHPDWIICFGINRAALDASQQFRYRRHGCLRRHRNIGRPQIQVQLADVAADFEQLVGSD